MIIQPSALPAKALRSRRALPTPPAPFTLPHFRAWAADLILDTGESWHPEPFQEAFLEDVFGGCPECWLVVPEGNGKTTLVAGFALYHAEHREFAEVPIAASSREQAGIMYRQAEGFVLRSPRMYEPVFSPIQAAKGKLKTNVPRFNCLEGYRRINHYKGGRIQIFAADDATGDGVIPTLAIVDELHRHRTLGLYRTWAGKLNKRAGQIVTISTAGEPGSEFEVTREALRRGGTATRKGSFVRVEGKRTVLHEWAVAPKDDVEDMAVVKAANPFSGITLATLTDKRSSDTMTLSHWKRLTCNIAERGNNAAIQEAEWAGAETVERIPPGERVWVGLDCAWKWDTTAAVPLWQGPEFWLLGPAEVLTPPRDGTTLHPDEVKGALLRIHAGNPIDTVVMDISYAADIAAWIESEIGATVLDRSQTNQWAAEDYARFMEGLRNGTLKHSGDDALKQHALNAVARILPMGDPRFDRPAETRNTSMQERRVIDALTSASMVYGIASMQPVEPLEPMVAFR